MPSFRIYISSTYLDLRDYRAAAADVIRSLNHLPVGMEGYPASDERPLDKCRADVASCQAILCIVAWRYGFIPPYDNPENKSISELEYEEACRAGTGIKRLVFLLDESARWDVSMVDKYLPGSEGIARFRARLKLRHTTNIKGFADIHDLCNQVRASLEASLPIGATIPKLLEHRADRDRQKTSIAKSCDAQLRKVHCFAVPGDEFQCLHQFLDVVHTENLAQECGNSMLSPPFDVAWPQWELPEPFPTKMLDNLGVCFRDQPFKKPEHENGDAYRILEEGLSKYEAVVFRVSISTLDWEKHGPGPVREFFQFWERWTGLRRRHPVFVFFAIEMLLGEEMGYFKRWRYRRANREIEHFLEGLKETEPYPELMFRVVDRLRDVPRDAAIQWAKLGEVRNHCGSHDPVACVSRIYKKVEALRMQSLAGELRKLLEHQCLCENEATDGSQIYGQ